MPVRPKSPEPSVSTNPFVGFPRPPAPAEIQEVLGRSAVAWDALRTHIAGQFEAVTEEWAVPAVKVGWSFRLQIKKRTILHLGPRSKHFVVAMILSEKAVKAIRESGLSPDVVAMVEQATKYPEGRGIRFEVRSLKDIEVIEALARIKMEN